MCVCPEMSTSTSICRAIALSESRSPLGTHWCPCVTPIRIGECATVTERGSALYAGVSGQPETHTWHTHLVIVAADNVDVWRDGPEVFVRLAVAEVSSAQDLLYLPRN